MTTVMQVPHADIRQLIQRSNYIKLSETEDRTMTHCLMLSHEVWVGMIGQEIACIWGVAPPSLMSDQAYMWLFTTKLVEEHQFAFVRHSQIEMKKLLERYSMIVGHSHVNADRSIRWLKWLGAVFGKPEGLRVPFVIRKKDG